MRRYIVREGLPGWYYVQDMFSTSCSRPMKWDDARTFAAWQNEKWILSLER